MAQKPVAFRPPQVAKTKSLKGLNLNVLAGTEVVLAAVQLNNFGYPVLESIYFDGSAGGNGFLKFRVTLNGVLLPFDWNDSYNPKGASNQFDDVGENLPPGGLLEVRVKNEHATDPFEGYSNGEVAFYDQPI